METSPVIKKSEVKVMFGFPEAVGAIIEGKSVTRAEWPDGTYGHLKEGFLIIHLEDGDHQWIVSEADMKSNDWEIVK